MILGPNWSVADDGWPVLAIAGVITILVSIIFLPLGCFLLGLMVWLSHVLRVPNRHTNVDDQTIYAPCDGVILEIVPDKFPDGLSSCAKAAQRITIQTRLYDAQLQTSPITGHIVENHLLPGSFESWGNHPVSWQAARLVNERREIHFCDSFNRVVVLVQMGSKTARQLICRLLDGKFVQAGSPLGMTRVAGVIDLYIPAECKILSVARQHVIAGETAVAQFFAEPSKNKNPRSNKS
jgi:phosphatidylserine decarboxylase